MSHEIVEELWSKSGLDKDQLVARESALKRLLEIEKAREARKKELFTRFFGSLSKQDRGLFTDELNQSSLTLANLIKNNGTFRLPPEGELLNTLRADFKEFQEANSGQPFVLLKQEGVNQEILGNLLYHLAVGSFKEKKAEADREAAQRLLNQIEEGVIVDDEAKNAEKKERDGRVGGFLIKYLHDQMDFIPSLKNFVPLF